MKVSVIIPAFNEQEYLPSAVDAVKKQKFPPEDFEIIVVDNNSSDRTAQVAKDLGVKVVSEKHQGTNWARQAGYKASKNEILAFLDADCAPPPLWLKKITRIFALKKNANLGLISGPYFYYDLQPYARKINLFANKHLAPVTAKIIQNLTGKNAPIAWGGNMCIRREALEKIKGFNTKLKMYGDDTDTAIRIMESGFDVRYDPNIVVNSSGRRIKNEGQLLHLKYIKAYLQTLYRNLPES